MMVLGRRLVGAISIMNELLWMGIGAFAMWMILVLLAVVDLCLAVKHRKPR